MGRRSDFLLQLLLQQQNKCKIKRNQQKDVSENEDGGKKEKIEHICFMKQ